MRAGCVPYRFFVRTKSGLQRFNFGFIAGLPELRDVVVRLTGPADFGPDFKHELIQFAGNLLQQFLVRCIGCRL